MPKDSGSPERAILIIEDEEIVRQMVALILEQDGFRILQAGDSDEALRLWDANREVIDLLITDVEIPGRSGPDMARQFKSEKPSLHIIISTGSVGLPIELIEDFASERNVLEKGMTLSEEDAQGYFDYLCASAIAELICTRKLSGIPESIQRCEANGITFQRLSRTDDILSAGQKSSSQAFQIRVVGVDE